MNRRMAGDAQVLRLLVADQQRRYGNGELTDEDLGLLDGRPNDGYDPDSLREALEEDSSNPEMEYVVDAHGYPSYQLRPEVLLARQDRVLRRQSPEAVEKSRARTEAYFQHLESGLNALRAQQIAAEIQKQGFGPEQAMSMALAYLQQEE